MFDDRAVKEVVTQTALPLAPGRTLETLRQALEHIALAYYWDELEPHGRHHDTGFDALGDALTTPSRLRDRLTGIARYARRVFDRTSRRPLLDKVQELLELLGCDREGRPLKRTRMKTRGAEHSAVRLCLQRAIRATEQPPRGYLPPLEKRPWKSQRLQDAIDALVVFSMSGEAGKQQARQAARDIHGWATWSVRLVRPMVASSADRHGGDPALDKAMERLAEAYRAAFGKAPSLYRSTQDIQMERPNAWVRFLLAVLERMAHAHAPPIPEATALRARFRRLRYGSGKNRL